MIEKANLLEAVIHAAHVFLFGVAAGIWTGVIVTGKAPRTTANPVVFIDWIQGAHSIMKWFMPGLLIATLLSGFPNCWFFRGHLGEDSLLGFGLLCLIFALVVTRLFEIPIVERAARWISVEPPASWAEQRDRWMKFHAVRAVLTLTGFASALASLVVL